MRIIMTLALKSRLPFAYLPLSSLPLAFVVRGRSKALRPIPGPGFRFETAGTLRRLTALPVLGETMRGDDRLLAVGRGLLARDAVLAVAEPMERYMADLVDVTRNPDGFGDDLKNWIEI